jgi:type IV secretion system protein VirD4
VDFKGELAAATMKRRRRMGHRIVLLDPYRMVTNSPDTFNPLQFIDKNSPYAIDEIRDLAESQVIRTGQEKEPHWNDVAEAWLGAMTAAVVQYGDADDRSLQTVRGLLSDPQKMEMAIKLLCGSDAWQGMLARMGHQLTHFKDKELGSTLTTVNRHLRYLDTLAVAASTRTSSFDPSGLVRGKMTVYLVLPPEHARAQSPLLRMWISSMLRAVVRGGLQERKLVHFVLDEAASLGHLEQLDDAVDKYRGYGCRLMFFYQSLGQLKKCFPEGQDQNLLSNVTQVFFGVNEPQTAEYVSNRLGEQTIVVDSGGRSRGTSQQYSVRDYGSSTTSSNSNHNWQQHGRKLLKPEEVMALSPRTAITFAPGVPPIGTRLIRYYEGRPDALWRMLVKGLRAFFCSLLLLGTSVVAANWLAANYQYRLNHLRHIPVRRVPTRRLH